MNLENLPLQIEPAELVSWLKEPAPPQVLDVREPWEVEICHFENSIVIPMGQVPQRLEEIDERRPVVVLCHHGARSLQVTMFLRSQGYNKATNLIGGIDAWARDFDSTMPTY